MLTRTQKARLLRRVSTKTLDQGTLAGALIGGFWDLLLAPIAGLLGHPLPHGMAAPIALALPALGHLVRFRLVHVGWGAVAASEVPIFADCLEGAVPEGGVAKDGGLPMAAQQELAARVQAQGWLAWSEVDAILEKHACPPRYSFSGGGEGFHRIARRSDFQAALDERAWLAGNLQHRLPVASLAPRRARM